MKESDKKEAFAERMTTILNHGALNLAMGIGYRTGLFDAMASLGRPSTAGEIAAAANLDERYVREWLGVMFTGEIVELTAKPGEAPAYHLPPEHGAILSEAGEGPNFGVYTQEIPLLTHCAMEKVTEAFRSGDGVSYDTYPAFQGFMAELANAKHREMLVNRFIPSVEEGGLFSLLRAGIRVCDLGCGEGVALLEMAEAFPNSRFVGVDVDEAALAVARRHAARSGLSNIEFILRDAAAIKDDPEMAGTFDYIVALDAIHDQRNPTDALAGIHHMLADDGLFSMVDISAHTDHAGNRDHPMGPFLYAVSLMHCLPVGKVDGGEGLGMMWGREKAVAMLRAAGFGEVSVEEIPEDPFNLHFSCRKSKRSSS